jgi:ATP-dependent 26S proteasome regulatory subunit
MGRHLSRGLLLWGPPGTGKTHTVRYLTGRLTGATVIILAGGAVGAIGAFGTVARRLAPSVVILEDVDLVAEDRYSPMGGSNILFELMDQMSGLGEDADVAFVLTTNRPDALEPALAARPGRVDLAIEIPLPDAPARTRLLELYGRGLDLRLDDPAAVVERTEGVTASFVKELLRKASLIAIEAGRDHVTDADVSAGLDELLSETSALTRVLLGAGGEDGLRAGSQWLERFPEWDEGDDGSSITVVLEPDG